MMQLVILVITNKICHLIMNKYSLGISQKLIMEDMGKKHYLVLNKTIKIQKNIQFEELFFFILNNF